VGGVTLRGLRKRFGDTDVIRGIDLDIADGEFMVFVGPSGCGKTTTLRMIAGLESASEGDILIDGARCNDVHPAQRGAAMVFQSYALYPHMTVSENMGFGMKLSGSSRDEMDQRVRKAAKMLQIDHLLDRLPKELSGGQRQRVAIGRAITRDPRVFLFDEPLSNLDAALRVATRLEIAKLHHDMENVTMIYVTHDQVEAMTLADRICVLRDGRLEQVGTPQELYDSPNSVFVAGFIGSPKMNFLEGPFAAAFGAHIIGMRSEHLDLVPEGQGQWSGKVVHTEDLGSDNYVFVDVGGAEPLIVRQAGKSKIALNTTVHVRVRDGLMYRFDQNGRPIR